MIDESESRRGGGRADVDPQIEIANRNLVQRKIFSSEKLTGVGEDGNEKEPDR